MLNINIINNVMETKVSEKWFEENGWILTDVPFEDTIDGRGRITHITQSIYCLRKGQRGAGEYGSARWDHTVRVTRDKRGKVVGASNWYSFSAFGKNFHIENAISHRRFTVEQIESALKIVGLWTEK